MNKTDNMKYGSITLKKINCNIHVITRDSRIHSSVHHLLSDLNTKYSSGSIVYKVNVSTDPDRSRAYNEKLNTDILLHSMCEDEDDVPETTVLIDGDSSVQYYDAGTLDNAVRSANGVIILGSKGSHTAVSKRLVQVIYPNAPEGPMGDKNGFDFMHFIKNTHRVYNTTDMKCAVFNLKDIHRAKSFYMAIEECKRSIRSIYKPITYLYEVIDDFNVYHIDLFNDDVWWESGYRRRFGMQKRLCTILNDANVNVWCYSPYPGDFAYPAGNNWRYSDTVRMTIFRNKSSKRKDVSKTTHELRETSLRNEKGSNTTSQHTCGTGEGNTSIEQKDNSSDQSIDTGSDPSKEDTPSDITE